MVTHAIRVAPSGACVLMARVPSSGVLGYNLFAPERGFRGEKSGLLRRRFDWRCLDGWTRR
jgi:hypothetical protein